MKDGLKTPDCLIIRMWVLGQICKILGLIDPLKEVIFDLKLRLIS